MSDTVQAFLDSGALYLAVGAMICIVLGVGAAKRLFQGANKIKTPQEGALRAFQQPGTFTQSFRSRASAATSRPGCLISGRASYAASRRECWNSRPSTPEPQNSA